MNYKKRTILLIIVWILLFAAIRVATFYYGYARSVEMAEQTIRDSLTRVDASLDKLISNEVKIRAYYEENNRNKGAMVPFLQKHGLEETVPSRDHLKKYAELLNADYIAVLDAKRHTAASYGELAADSFDMQTVTEEMMTDWLTSGNAIVSAQNDRSMYERELADGYTLIYQVNNAFTNTVQNEAFSWRAILGKMKFANDAYLIVISDKDDKILIHPDESMIGKSYDSLGFGSKEAFLKSYKKPDADGIAYQRSLLSLLDQDNDVDFAETDINLLGRGSGYMKTNGLYVVCVMPDSMMNFYVHQQNDVLNIYVLASLFVLCYILLNFRWMKRHETDPQYDQEDRTGRSGRFMYDRAWSRRLIAFCIIVLMIATTMYVHAELLSNSSRTKIREAQTKRLEKKIAEENEEQRQQLDLWYNITNSGTADVISYTLTRDKGLQNRKTLQELSNDFGNVGIYIFDQEGRTRVTNMALDHIDLNEKQIPRMSATFLPLLSGTGHSASTPLTESYTSAKQDGGDEASSGAAGNEDTGIMNESYIAYAGVTLRNSEGLCDGCLGTVMVSLNELWNGAEYVSEANDTYAAALDLASSSGEGFAAITSSQLTLILIAMLHLAACFILFCCLSILKRDCGLRPAAAAGDAGTAVPVKGSTRKNEDLFYNLFGNQRDRHFHERWNRDITPLSRRTPEQQLLFVARCILFALFLWIVFVFLTKGQYLDENSMIRDVVRGGWKKGINLYAITAAEMIVISLSALCMVLHSLVYFIARFSTPKGETICHLVYSMITYATVFVTIYYTLSVFGVHTSTILKGVGIVGIIITFGAQSTIADILSGMFLIFEDVIHVGDYISVGDVSGVVNNIGVRMTKIQSFGTIISVNNADLKSMRNMSYADARVSCSIKIDNREDLADVREIIDRELPGIEERLKETGSITTDVWYSGVDSVDETGMTLEFVVFCRSDKYLTAQRTLNEEVISMCQRNGIRLAVNRSLLESASEDDDAGDKDLKKEEEQKNSDISKELHTKTKGGIP